MKKKVLLMGKGSAGKTSMRSIIFANYTAKDTRRLGPTLDVEHSNIRFLGNMVLNLWDCGGQDHFMDSYFSSSRDSIFKNVAVLIYVFDVASHEWQEDLRSYQNCLEALVVHSREAQVFCLIHKMDLVEPSSTIFEDRVAELEHPSDPLPVKCFPTTIFDESLYKAWSYIIHEMIPNVRKLELHLAHFCKACEADEVVLFERATFLVIASAQRKEHPDPKRYEKISTYVKQFKHSCTLLQTQFTSLELRRPTFSAYIDQLTPNTCVLVIMSDPTIQSAATQMNIHMARRHFEKLEASASMSNGIGGGGAGAGGGPGGR
ncbi:MAG: ras-related GTP-binding protein A-like protein [Piptocephalis tieghemiana]|nr:MAG: ras-related GTP-binding protein A-like protein [Piptocephalis tieghemiana]